MSTEGLPALAAHGLLQGFAAVGLDATDVAHRCGLEGDLTVPGRLLPDRAWHDMWARARRQRPVTTLAMEVGQALPFGAFGLVDYMAGSAAHAGAALESVAGAFRLLARGIHLELSGPDQRPRVTVVDTGGGSLDDDEFIIGTLVARFRRLAPGLPVLAAGVRRAVDDGGAAFSARLGAEVTVGATCGWLEFGPPGRAAVLSSADPALHETLRGLVRHLGLGETTTDLEAAVRGRLRLTLPDGRADVRTVARALGVSVRTLHRRLAASGRTWQAVVDDFRAHEAERLLILGRDVGTVAHQLGFSDASTFSRAFRRWRGVAPSSWAAARGR